MKKILLLLTCVLAINFTYGQYHYIPYTNIGKNPNSLNTDGENPAALLTGWSSIWAGPASSSVAYSANQSIPFSFDFNGSAVTSFKACNAGFITFNTASSKKPSSFGSLTLPNNNIPSSSVCVLGVKPITNATYQSQIVTKTFGTAPNRQFWIQYNFFSEANITSGWTYWSIVLEETTNYIYIVDMKTLCVTTSGTICTSNVKMSAGVQVDSVSAFTVANSPNLGAVNITQNLFDATDNSYYKFKPGAKLTNNAEGFASTLPDYMAMTQAPFSLSGVFKNVGSATISSCDINYSVDNGAVVTASAGTISINPNGTAKVTHPTTWAGGSIGNHKITMWLSNINGNPDDEGIDDSITKIVNVVEDFVVRKPLHEVFTSSTCGPCRPGNINLDENILPQYPADDNTVIKYQMYFPGSGDPYYTNECQTRATLYGVNAIPNMQVDGGWNGNANSYSTTLYNQFKSKPSFIKIDASHIINFKRVEVNVTVTPLMNFNNTNLRVFVAVLEKKTTKNVKTNGETEFTHVMKKMLPNANGTVLGTVTKNVDKVFPQMTYNVPGDYRLPPSGQSSIINVNTENSIEELTDCEVVVFVQDIVTKEIYQSTWSSGTVLAVDDIANSGKASISVFPSPSTGGETTVKFSLNNNPSDVKINVYNTLGQVVETINSSELVAGSNTISFNTENYAKGVYTIKIEGANFSATEKFIIQ
ncbi:MAG: T9SS type A sorting domain-containing protein [Bacteroidota bacterium]